MSDHEDAVERFLRDHADELERRTTPVSASEAMHHAVSPDLSVRGSGPRRDGNRRRGLALVAAACVAFAGVGGFVAGRASFDPPSQLAAGSNGDDEAAERDAGMAAAAPGVATSGAGGFAPFDAKEGMPTFEPVFFRTTAEGIAIRSYLETYDQQVVGMECPEGEWCPPAECSPTSNLVAELSSAEAVTQGWMQGFEITEPLVVLGAVSFGYQEGAPVSAWVVRTNGDVATVRIESASGQVDEMAPVNGWATLALAGDHDEIDVVGLDGAGTVVGTAAANRNSWYQPEACMPPPPSLPEPTGEPPADVAAAEAGVREAYEMAFTAGSDPEVVRGYLEDPDSYEEARQQTKESYPEASDTIEVEVTEIRFVDATTAALYFELTYDGGALFGQQIGFSKLIDGRWVVAKDTMCMVLGWGGGMCEGWGGDGAESRPAPVPPPSPPSTTSGG